jgi:hypothetical protein
MFVDFCKKLGRQLRYLTRVGQFITLYNQVAEVVNLTFERCKIIWIDLRRKDDSSSSSNDA